MKTLSLDTYIIDALMRDLAGHDRSPAAFLVYLWLWRHSEGAGKPAFGASLQDIAYGTGLSKSAVQAAVRRLKVRQLITAERKVATHAPIYRVMTPWRAEQLQKEV